MVKVSYSTILSMVSSNDITRYTVLVLESIPIKSAVAFTAHVPIKHTHNNIVHLLLEAMVYYIDVYRSSNVNFLQFT